MIPINTEESKLPLQILDLSFKVEMALIHSSVSLNHGSGLDHLYSHPFDGNNVTGFSSSGWQFCALIGKGPVF